MDTTATNRSVRIPKDFLNYLSYAKEEVLDCPHLKNERIMALRKAAALGNTHKGKVRVFFCDDLGNLLWVDTTVWALCEHHITVKSGNVIPIRSISEVTI